nr:4-hydroxybutyryl-CoA dehydratase [Desulfobacteraceae bacterium]
VGDVLIGAAQTIAEYNGVHKAAHIKDKLIEMNHLNETLYCGSLSCAAEGHAEPSGTWCVDTLLANVAKQNVTRFPYEIARLAQDIAGGLMVTLPSEADFKSPETGPMLQQYFQGSQAVPVPNRMRILRLIENLTLGTAAVGYLTESMHGAGSPQAQRIMIARQVDMKDKQHHAKKLCGIDADR